MASPTQNASAWAHKDTCMDGQPGQHNAAPPATSMGWAET